MLQVLKRESIPAGGPGHALLATAKTTLRPARIMPRWETPSIEDHHSGWRCVGAWFTGSVIGLRASSKAAGVLWACSVFSGFELLIFPSLC